MNTLDISATRFPFFFLRKKKIPAPIRPTPATEPTVIPVIASGVKPPSGSGSSGRPGEANSRY